MSDFIKIPFAPDYLINKNGEIIGKKGKLLKPILDKKTGYFRVSLYVNKKLKITKIHRAVWFSFVGQYTHPMQINHINGIKTDNNLKNLEIVTPSQNMKHAWDSGLNKGKTKLTKKQIEEILSYPTETGAGEISKVFKVCRQTINLYRLKKFGTNWKKRKNDLPKNLYWIESKKAFIHVYYVDKKRKSKAFKTLESYYEYIKTL